MSRALGRPRSSRRGRVLLAAGLLALLVVAVALLPAARNVVGAALDADTDAVRRQLLGLGAPSPILLSMAILSRAVVPYPGGIATAACQSERSRLVRLVGLAVLLQASPDLRAAAAAPGRLRPVS